MLVIFNPTAGARRRLALEQALAALRARGVRPDLAETSARGDATRLAREAAARGVGLIVAAGGDGTIAEVAAGIAGSDAALGVLPFGTANVLAQELGLPMAPARAAARLVEGQSLLLRPGLARFADGREQIFVQMLGAGFDAGVVASLDPRCKLRLGRAAYVAQTLRNLRGYRPTPIELTIDGGRELAMSVILTKGRFYAGRYLLAPEARQGEAGFHVALFTARSAFATALLAVTLPLGLLPRMPGVRLLRGMSIVLTGAGPVQADGDAVGALPVQVTDLPTPIRLVGAALRETRAGPRIAAGSAAPPGSSRSR